MHSKTNVVKYYEWSTLLDEVHYLNAKLILEKKKNLSGLGVVLLKPLIKLIDLFLTLTVNKKDFNYTLTFPLRVITNFYFNFDCK